MKLTRGVHFVPVIVLSPILLADPMVGRILIGTENEKSPLSFCSVPIDQCLKTGIASHRIPHWIKCEEGNRDSIGSTQRTVNKLKGLIGFACPGVDLSERNSHLWPIKGILRFGQKFDSASAFGDSPVLLAKPGQNHAEDYVARRIARTFPQGLFCNGSSAFEGSKRLLFIFRKDMNRALKKFSWLSVVKDILRRLL